MDTNKAVELGFADGILKRASDTEDMDIPCVSMLYSQTNVVNFLMGKIAHKCTISPKSTESTTYKHRADDYMARFDIIKNWR